MSKISDNSYEFAEFGTPLQSPSFIKRLFLNYISQNIYLTSVWLILRRKVGTGESFVLRAKCASLINS